MGLTLLHLAQNKEAIIYISIREHNFVLSCNHKDNLTYNYPVIRDFFPTQLLAITKSFSWLVSHIVGFFMLGGLPSSFSLGINKPNMWLTNHSNKATPEKNMLCSRCKLQHNWPSTILITYFSCLLEFFKASRSFLRGNTI